MSELDRRTFLVLSAAALGATTARNTAATAADRLRQPLIVNALGGLEDPNPRPGSTDPSKDNPTPSQDIQLTRRVLQDAHASGLTAVNVTLGYVAGNMDPFETTVREIAKWDRLLQTHPSQLIKVQLAADILRAQSQGRIGIIYGFQNAAMMGSDPTRVDIFAALGVRVIQLTYNPANQLGDGSAVAENRGLSAFGHAVVARLNERRVMVDLSHSGEQTCLDAARASRQPISINHTGCRALVDLPRNKSDAELRLVAERGGFIGIYFMPFLAASGHASAADVLAHIDHAIQVCGEEHVGIGTDGPITTIDDLDAYKVRIAKEIAARRQAGIGAAGEGPDTLPFVIDLRGVDQFRHLADLLQRRGYSSTRIERILGLNFLRYAREVWGP